MKHIKRITITLIIGFLLLASTLKSGTHPAFILLTIGFIALTYQKIYTPIKEKITK